MLSSIICNYLLIICLIKCVLIFQDSYMRKGDMTTFLGLLFRPPCLRSYSYEYLRPAMPDYFVRAFNVSAV